LSALQTPLPLLRPHRVFPAGQHLYPLPDQGSRQCRHDPGVLPHLLRCHRCLPAGGDGMTTTHANPRFKPRFDQRRYDRLTVEAAISRMVPEDTKLAATLDAFSAKAGRPAYRSLVVHTLATAINTIHLVHVVECQQAGCTTCWAISLAVTAVTAHQTVSIRGGAR